MATAVLWAALHLLSRAGRFERRLLLLTPLVGLVVAGLAIAYAEITGKVTADVLFSGQDGLGPLMSNAATYSAGALVVLVVCKGLAYGAS